jgi:hypothetical protein
LGVGLGFVVELTPGVELALVVEGTLVLKVTPIVETTPIVGLGLVVGPDGGVNAVAMIRFDVYVIQQATYQISSTAQGHSRPESRSWGEHE